MNVLQQDTLADSFQKVILSILVKKVKNKQRDESIHINATKLQEICSTQPLKPHHYRTCNNGVTQKTFGTLSELQYAWCLFGSKILSLN
jgi:dsRNA-specific ribonuclease